MDDSAHRKPPARRSLEPRVSSVKSIITPRRQAAEATTLAQILESLNLRHNARPSGLRPTRRILRSYVHALERLYPKTRFAMRLSPPIGRSTRRGTGSDAPHPARGHG